MTEPAYKQAWSAAKLPTRFWSKVDVGSASNCWPWLAARDRDGYGLFSFPWGQRMAHRVAYELQAGEIPAGKQLDHLCRNRACCNPAHLEPVDCRENIMRSPVANAAVNARKRSCAHGHEFSEANTYVDPSGRRTCRTCNNERQRRYVAKRRGA